MNDKHADTPDEAALVERVARAIAVTLDPYGGPNAAWQYRGDARAAIAEMQPEMAAAHEAGRRAGLEDAIAACETERQGWIQNGGGPGVIAAAECRKAIRALVQPSAATEAGE